MVARLSRLSFALSTLFGTALTASAAGLGEISILSRLGQPLNAEIEVRSSPGERLDDSCFRVEKSRPDDGGIPRLTRAELALKRSDARIWLVVRTTAAMREPLYLFAVRIGCGPDLVRDYALLLSPEERRTVVLPAAGDAPAVQAPRLLPRGEGEPVVAGAAFGSTPASIGRALYPYSRRLQRKFVEALIAANSGLGLKADSLVPAGAPLVMPDMESTGAASVAASAAKSRPREATAAQAALPDASKAKSVSRRAGLKVADRLRISGGEETVLITDPVLKMATALAERAVADPQRIEAQREMFRIEYRLLAGFGEPLSLVGDPAERRRLMQQRAIEFRRLADLFDGKPPAAEPAPVVLPAPPVPPVVASPAVAPPNPPPLSPAPAKTKLPAQVTAPAWVDWAFYGFMLTAVAGVAGFLVYRRRRDGALAGGLEALAETAPADGSAAHIFHLAGIAPGISEAPPVDPGIAAPNTPAAPVLDRAAPKSVPPAPVRPQPEVADFSVSDELPEEDSDVVELAEIMLAFGRVKGAAEVLKEYIESNPKEALPPWMKLLDVYRSAGMRSEFEEIARRLHQTYNVQVQGWDESAPDAERLGLPAEDLRGNINARSLEEFPHLVHIVDRLWASEAALEFLEQLLRDNRDGERIGFRREVAEEIIFLCDILRARLKLAA